MLLEDHHSTQHHQSHLSQQDQQLQIQATQQMELNRIAQSKWQAAVSVTEQAKTKVNNLKSRLQDLTEVS